METLVPSCLFWRAGERRDHSLEQNETNETPETMILPTLSPDWVVGLSREQVLEFQDIMNREYGAEFDYKTAWVEAHRVINFYNILLRNDNEVDSIK